MLLLSRQVQTSACSSLERRRSMTRLVPALSTCAQGRIISLVSYHSTEQIFGTATYQLKAICNRFSACVVQAKYVGIGKLCMWTEGDWSRALCAGTLSSALWSISRQGGPSMFILLPNVTKPDRKMRKYSLNKWFTCTFHHFLIPWRFASVFRDESIS